ncbi:hypothetical protein B8W68_19395 [Mycobacterium paraintracellulare]|nr:hypothetical protein B8W68_19395 [Mycobacterium paraintracellulare]
MGDGHAGGGLGRARRLRHGPALRGQADGDAHAVARVAAASGGSPSRSPTGVDGGDPLRPAPPRLRSPLGVDGGDPLRPAPPRLRSPLP